MADIQKQPDLTGLPIRPPVWDGQWENAYLFEHKAKLKVYYDTIGEITKKLAAELAITYNVPVESVSLNWLVKNPSYSIEEVESDI